MPPEPNLKSLRETIVGTFPDLSGSKFTLQTQGWHSVAVDVDDRLIFKFPRDEIAKKALEKEVALLAVIRRPSRCRFRTLSSTPARRCFLDTRS